MIQVTYVCPIIQDRYISRLLYTLYKYSPPDSFRFVLIDQCKDRVSPQVWEYIKDKVHLYLHPKRNLGYAKGCNEGIIHGLHWKTPYICCTNDDIEIMDSRWMDGISETFKMHDNIVGVVPMSPRVAGWGYGLDFNPEVLPYKEEFTKEDYDFLLKGDFSGIDEKIWPKHLPKQMGGTIVDGAAFIMVYFKMETLLDIGLMDEHFFPGCFLPDEKVMMGDLKYKPIKSIKKGDWVIGKYGKRCPVNAVHKKKYEGKVLELSFVGTTEKVRLTPDHKVFMVRKRPTCWSRTKKKVVETEAKNLKKRDLVYCPIPVATSFREGGIYGGKEDFRIYGYFLAEGNYIKKVTNKGKKLYGLSFSFHIDEKNYIREVYEYFKNNGVPVRIYERPEKTIATVEVYSKDIANKFKEMFGEYSWGKSIKKRLLNSDTGLLRELVIAYANGDGCINSSFKKKSKRPYKQLCIKSASSELLTDVRNILLRLGIPSLLYLKKKTPQRGRRPVNELYVSQNYFNRLFKLPERRVKIKKTPRNEVFEHDGKLFYPIKEVREVGYKGSVYDLEVGIDHSYIVGTMAVHNSGEDYDYIARTYIKDKRLVSTARSWVWHHWTKSKDLFASGELEDPYYKPPTHPYWNHMGHLWPPEKNGGHEFDVWGHYRDEEGKRTPLKRIDEVFIDQI